jgi:hypothetical protein
LLLRRADHLPPSTVAPTTGHWCCSLGGACGGFPDVLRCAGFTGVQNSCIAAMCVTGLCGTIGFRHGWGRGWARLERSPESCQRERRSQMPLYMDVHNKVEGLTAEAVAEAHRKDLAIQDQHGVTYHRYWFNEETGQVFCLVEAPTKEAAARVHREAHGLVADELIEVQEGS